MTAMATMKAIDIRNGAGPVNCLFMNEIARPKIADDQALVKIKAFGINRMDLSQREGRYPVPPQAPKTLGVEFSGVVVEIASEGEGFQKGDGVFGLAYGGAYAEYIAVSTHMLVNKPDEMSWEECAGVPETWITALQAMNVVGGFEPGKSILWHAGASSVSIAGQQLSIANGASKVYATARSDDKCDFCTRELGTTAAYNLTTDWSSKVLEDTNGQGVDIIIDYLGPETFGTNLKAAAKDGRVVSLAMLSGSTLKAGQTDADFGDFLRKRLRYEGSSLRSRSPEYQRHLRDQLVTYVVPKLRNKTFKVFVERIFSWTEIQQAHRMLESNQTKGKLICKIP